MHWGAWIAFGAQIVGVIVAYKVAHQAARQRAGFALLTGWAVGAIVMAVPLYLTGYGEGIGAAILSLPAAWLGRRRGRVLPS